MPDRRSPAAKQWRKLYQTPTWKRIRRAKLSKDPLCELCQARGRTVLARVVNHRIPHKGNWALFVDPGNHQSTCKPCHDGEIQSREKTGRDYDKAVGLDGFPIDPKHYWNTGVAPAVAIDRIPVGTIFPIGLSPSRIPLTIVCGPPAGGKSTYVATHRDPEDVVIDLDEIIRETTGRGRDADTRTRRCALKERNNRLFALSSYDGPAKAAWFITTAALPGTRRRWAAMLKPTRVIVIATPEEVCVERARNDPERRAVLATQCRIIHQWWRGYRPWLGDTQTFAPQDFAESGTTRT
jgi:5-methylcytosine-specific restriction protein A